MVSERYEPEEKKVTQRWENNLCELKYSISELYEPVVNNEIQKLETKMYTLKHGEAEQRETLSSLGFSVTEKGHQVQILDRPIDAIRKKMEGNNAQLVFINTNMASVVASLKSITVSVNELNEKLAGIEGNLIEDSENGSGCNLNPLFDFCDLRREIHMSEIELET